MTKKKKPEPFAEWGVKPDASAAPFAGKTLKERQADFVRNRKAAGLVLVREWIPWQCEVTLRRVAAELRRQAPTSTAPSEPSPKPSGTSGKPKE